MLTQEHYNILLQYETQMKTAPLGYIRGLYSKDTKVLKEICSHYNIKLSNLNCASCVLGACKQLSKLFFEYKQINTQNPKLKTKKTKT
jgi:hypothetical protein